MTSKALHVDPFSLRATTDGEMERAVKRAWRAPPGRGGLWSRAAVPRGRGGETRARQALATEVASAGTTRVEARHGQRATKTARVQVDARSFGCKGN